MNPTLKKLILVTVFTAFVLPAIPGAAFEFITQTETVVYNDVEIDIVKMADNFIVLFDSSSSMGKPYKNTGKTKLAVQKAALKERNAYLPDLGFNAGLYSFTPKTGTISIHALKPYYEMQPYDKAAFAAAIDQLPDKASGPTLMQDGLHELGKVLDGLQGRTVVVLFTDGAFTGSRGMELPIEYARDLAGKHDVCFYVVSSAPGKLEAQMLDRVASINACSRVVSFDDMIEYPEYTAGALFVVIADIVERAFDVEKVIGALLDDILFDFNSAAIHPSFAGGLDALGEFMQADTDAYAIVGGFTDDVGSQEFNLGLSQRRAEAVGDYLVDRFSIDPSRVITHWYGKAAPVADNATPEGRLKNRRVEIIMAK